MFSFSSIRNNTNNNIYPNTLGSTNRTKEQSKKEFLYSIFEDENKGVNGYIDEGVFQGSEGDCWLMSGVLSLSYTKDGRDLIHNAIKQDKKGDYYVDFKGLNTRYKITKQELERANISTLEDSLGIKKSKYSTGDDDMLLLELAVEKAVKDFDIPVDDGITGGSAFYLYSMLGDSPTGYSYGNKNGNVEKLLNYYMKNQDTSSATIGVIDSFAGLEEDHAYAVYSMDKDTTTLVNPWNSTEGLVVPNKFLMENLDKFDISVMDMEG